MFPEPAACSPNELRAGLEAEFEREITEDDVAAFARLSGDCNPLHVDPAYARETRYEGRIVHGAFQVGLASALLGMHLPGRSVLLGSVNARFMAPLYYPCRVRVHGEIRAWNLENRAGQLNVVVQDTRSMVPTAEITMAFTLHEKRDAEEPSPPAAVPTIEAPGQRVILVTGASGGLGAAITADLARDHTVVGTIRARELPEPLNTHPNVVPLRLDFERAGWQDALRDALAGRPLYGVVHAAWPGAPRGGLLQVHDEILRSQVFFATTVTVGLARALYALVGPDGGRLVALGSLAGRTKPALPLGAYSLAKATLEHTVALLAPELARKRVAINAVCPSYVPVGINREGDDRARKREAAHVPMGRLCTPNDVASIVRYLLLPQSAFLSGQSIVLSGGQL